MGSKADFQKYVDQLFDTQYLTNNGPMVRELEAKLEQLLDVEHCILVNNATLGLEIVVEALGLTGEVIVPSFTFVASAHSVARMGLEVAFVDIDAETHSVNIDSVRAAINEKTSAILAVHLWGMPAAIDELEAIGNEFGIPVIYDAAHAFGNSYKGKKLGGFGKAEVFSFHATKFFNTFEGGAITTNDGELARVIRLKRGFGIERNDHIVSLGTNAKMTEVCAAMGLVNLEILNDVIKVNQSNYEAYVSGFAGSGIGKMFTLTEEESTNHQYAVLELADEYIAKRDDLLAHLEANNVFARKYFWPACHNMEPYKSLPRNANIKLPVTDLVASRVIILPTGTAVDQDDCLRIAQSCVEFVKH